MTIRLERAVVDVSALLTRRQTAERALMRATNNAILRGFEPDDRYRRHLWIARVARGHGHRAGHIGLLRQCNRLHRMFCRLVAGHEPGRTDALRPVFLDGLFLCALAWDRARLRHHDALEFLRHRPAMAQE